MAGACAWPRARPNRPSRPRGACEADALEPVGGCRATASHRITSPLRHLHSPLPIDLCTAKLRVLRETISPGRKLRKRNVLASYYREGAFFSETNCVRSDKWKIKFVCRQCYSKFELKRNIFFNFQHRFKGENFGGNFFFFNLESSLRQ